MSSHTPLDVNRSRMTHHRGGRFLLSQPTNQAGHFRDPPGNYPDELFVSVPAVQRAWRRVVIPASATTATVATKPVKTHWVDPFPAGITPLPVEGILVRFGFVT